MGKDAWITWLITAIATIGVIAGAVLIYFGFRRSEAKPEGFAAVDGVLKHDWARTGNIDFHAQELESPSPQPLTLRVEERRVTQNAVGQDVVELRWRLATLEEAKELVVCWLARHQHS
jgi:hypothetical protein